MRLFVKPGNPMTAIWSKGTKIMTKEFGVLVDMESGCWATVLGHNHPEVVMAIHEQVDLLIHTHHFFETEHPQKLIEELTEAANLSVKYSGSFLSSGSEAVSLAVKLSEILTGRTKKLCMTITYLGACADLRQPRDRMVWDDLDVTECIKCSDHFNCSSCGRFDHLDYSQYASFVFEPGNSGGLVITPPDKLITFLVGKVRETGGLIVVNEVTTGFGRTGKWFGFQHYTSLNNESNAPDFIAVGKGLGNGYPISAVLVKDYLAIAAESTGFRYVQSHIDDPFGCRIAREVIRVMKNDKLVLNGQEKGTYLRAKLNDIAEKYRGIKEIRGRGAMNVVILEPGFSAEVIFRGLLEAGYFCGYSEQLGFIHLYFSLIISQDEIDGFCKALGQVLDNIG